MGGGDLNLKKSWHPQTMKNQEKVWKAEQAKSQEDRKLKDLRREIEEEKTREELKHIGRSSGVLPQEDKKLEWMYKNSNELINRDEYLLGRTIDKSFEVLHAEEQRKDQNMVGVKQSINHVEHECIPFSIRAYRNMESTEQVDLQRKVMEDPLMLIKQREMESRKKLLENPVKLKELHRILKTDEMLKKPKRVKKSKKSKKSKKKHKKHSKSSTNNGSSDSESDNDNARDLDKELAKRYKKLNKEEDFSGLNLSKLLEAKFETLTKELDKAAGSKRKNFRRDRSSSSDDNKRNRSTEREHRTKESYEHKRLRTSHSRSPNNNYKPRRSLTRSPDEPRKRQYSTSPSVERDITRKPHNSKKYLESRSQSRDRNKKYENRWKEDDKRARKENNKLVERRRRSRSASRNHSKRYENSDNRSRQEGHKGPQRQRQHRSRSRSSRDRQNRQRSRTRSPNHPKRRNLSKPLRNSSHSPLRRERSGDSKEKSGLNSRSKQSQSTATHKKLSDAEKEERLREMMENANWRENDRVKSVQKHREANAREEELYKNQDFDKEFINKEVKKAIATQSSIGSRIRSNLNNIQRTSAAMNSNFTKK